MKINQANTALIVVDLQNDFMPNGVLPVPYADELIEHVNNISLLFDNVILTQDWHPENHISFVSQYPDCKPYEEVYIHYGKQVLWPEHCVQGTYGAEFHPHLDIPHVQLVIRKGYNANIDSYSAFLEADRQTNTGLNGYLKARGIETVYITGVATDFCVSWTAVDARSVGLETIIIEDLCRAINVNDSLAQAWQEMEAVGVKRIHSLDLIQ